MHYCFAVYQSDQIVHKIICVACIFYDYSQVFAQWVTTIMRIESTLIKSTNRYVGKLLRNVWPWLY